MPTTTAPFLMFDGSAEAAFSFYAATIPDSHIIEMQKYGPEGPGPEGSVMVGRASIGGLEVMFSDSFVHHDFGFTPSISLFVTCASESEFDQVLAALADGGSLLMPPGDYGFSRKFGWLNDRYGVSWQINLP